VFTRNPATGEPGLYGDVLFGGQGEDVVAGAHRTEPLSVLDQRLPAVAAQLRAAADRLERHYADLCDIEFTVEDGRLWLLQVRVGKRSPRAALRIAADMARDPRFPLTRAAAVERVAALLAAPPTVTASPPGDAPILARGLGASPGLATGAIVTTPEDAIRQADAGRRTILVRAETSPDDVHGMARAAGILTARGGLASHAAVVARGWGIPAVVGTTGIEVRRDAVRFGSEMLGAGETITIDGADGRVFRGAVDEPAEVAPEAAELMAWALELGLPIGEAAASSGRGTTAPAISEAAASSGRGTKVAAPGAAPAHGAASSANAGPGPGPAAPNARRSPAPPPTSVPTLEAALLTIGVKGLAPREAVARGLLCAPDLLGPIIEGLIDAGLVTASAGALRLTEAGEARRSELVGAERAGLGSERAAEALEAFLAIDRRVKEVVTAWQMRPTEGEPLINDHADLAYDAAVLARLRDVQREATAWIEPLEPGWPRAGLYRTRLDEAIAAVEGGDGRFVASPRVDSYHGIWFELHEDLIGLAGRTRAEETAAGRA
jgi:pyruvate, orthophosphate dikinase